MLWIGALTAILTKSRAYCPGKCGFLEQPGILHKAELRVDVVDYPEHMSSLIEGEENHTYR